MDYKNIGYIASGPLVLQVWKIKNKKLQGIICKNLALDYIILAANHAT